MDAKLIDNEINKWFSTYGVITAERILGKYHIILPSKDLVNALKPPHSFFHRLLKIPLRNVLNGIIFEQANDYHIYAQKLFIDYLLSGETSKGEDAQGAFTRELLEEERKALTNLGEDFNKVQTHHDSIIASCQSNLIKITTEWNTTLESTLQSLNRTLKRYNSENKKSLIRDAVNHALIHTGEKNDYSLFVDIMNEVLKVNLTKDLKSELTQNISPILEVVSHFDEKTDYLRTQVAETTIEARAYRTQFYETILKVVELIKLLPDYKVNPTQDDINRATLNFDKSIGDTI
jgi:bacterioferritin (cytochrome b1)